MTDTKELVERLEAFNPTGTRVWSCIGDAADWIRRWAPVEDAARKVQTIDDIIKRTGRATVHELYYAQAELGRAITAALREEKP